MRRRYRVEERELGTAAAAGIVRGILAGGFMGLLHGSLIAVSSSHNVRNEELAVNVLAFGLVVLALAIGDAVSTRIGGKAPARLVRFATGFIAPAAAAMPFFSLSSNVRMRADEFIIFLVALFIAGGVGGIACVAAGKGVAWPGRLELRRAARGGAAGGLIAALLALALGSVKEGPEYGVRLLVIILGAAFVETLILWLAHCVTHPIAVRLRIEDDSRVERLVEADRLRRRKDPRAIEVARSALDGANRRERVTAHGILALALRELGREEESRRHLEEARGEGVLEDVEAAIAKIPA